MVRSWIFTIAFLTMGLACSDAHAIDLKHGLSTDVWITWPNRTELISKASLNEFPEWRTQVSRAEVDALRKAGFDFVRFTIDPSVFLHKPSPEKTRILLAGVKKGIAELRASGLDVVVDVHAIPGDNLLPGIDNYLQDEKLFIEYLAVVTDIGRAISNENPDQVAFEPINEPSIDCSTNAKSMRWPAMAKRIHATARAAAPKLSIIMQGGCNGSADGLTALKPAEFADNRIIWSFHSYEPRLFTHQGASWSTGNERFIDGLSYPPKMSEKQGVAERALLRVKGAGFTKEEEKRRLADLKTFIDDYFAPGRAKAMVQAPFEKVSNWVKINNIQGDHILVGEIGVIREGEFSSVPNRARAAYFAEAVTAIEKNGWAWAVWGWGGSFAIVESDENRKFVPILLDAMHLRQTN
jgi:endoglucanase